MGFNVTHEGLPPKQKYTQPVGGVEVLAAMLKYFPSQTKRIEKWNLTLTT